MVPAPFDDDMDVSDDIMPEITGPGATHKQIRTFGKLLSVVAFDDQEYLIGVQIATLLKRETFNMYRSMKIKNINIQRATPEQVEFLCKCKAVRAGTHSVTLIPYESGLTFASDALRRKTGSSKHPVGKRRAAKKKTEIVEDDVEDDEDDESYDEYTPSSSSRSKPSWAVRRSARKPQWYTDYTEAAVEEETETSDFEESRRERPSSRRGATKTIAKAKKANKNRATLADLVKIIFEPAFYCDLVDDMAVQKPQPAHVPEYMVSAPEEPQTYQYPANTAPVYPQFVPFHGVTNTCATANVVPRRFQPIQTADLLPQQQHLQQPIC